MLMGKGTMPDRSRPEITVSVTEEDIAFFAYVELALLLVL
jgi:hypothetical protein